LKNAHDLLKQIMNEVDTNHDGKIQYEGMNIKVLLQVSIVPADHVPTANLYQPPWA
jgi:hypothetical protein